MENVSSVSPASLGIGIIGAGFMGHTYAETVATLVEHAHLAGIHGGSRAPALAAEYNVPHLETLEAMIDSPYVHAVCIATPHARHGEQALAAAEAGKHLLIDKPMASSVSLCDAIIEACRQNHVRLSVTFTQRNRVGFQKAKERIDSGEFGALRHIRTHQVVANGLDNVPSWQLDKENKGTLFGHGVHNFDLLRVLTGREIYSVVAKCRTWTGAPVEATSDALVTMDDGSVHSFFCSFEAPAPGFPRSEFGASIFCERGLIALDTYGETRACGADGTWKTIAVQPSIDWAGKGFLDPVRLETYAGILRDLVVAVHEDRTPAITGWDGRQAVAAALAAYASSRSHREVRID